MPFIVEQRRVLRPPHSLQMVRDWSECLGSECETHDDALKEISWWQEYDTYYSCTAWEYRVRKIKDRKKRGRG